MCYPNKGVSIYSESICPVTTNTNYMYARVDEGSIIIVYYAAAAAGCGILTMHQMQA